MNNRLGTVVGNESTKDHIVIKNPEGHHFQISHTAHMVWNMLDGDTELDSIAQRIGAIAEIEPQKMRGLIDQIVEGLKEVDLVD